MSNSVTQAISFRIRAEKVRALERLAKATDRPRSWHIEQALGESEKKPFEEEVRIMETGRHSIIAAMNLKKGQRLGKKDVVIKRPGTGILPKYLKTVIGGKVLRDIEHDSPIMETDIERIESDR